MTGPTVAAAERPTAGDPERLRELSSQVLTLQSTAPTQFTTFAELDRRLPPPGPLAVVLLPASSVVAVVALRKIRPPASLTVRASKSLRTSSARRLASARPQSSSIATNSSPP